MTLKTGVIVLAAGMGKRMRSELPKVLHPLLNKPLLHHVVGSISPLSSYPVLVVVSHKKQEIIDSCMAYKQLEFIDQKEPLGTGHAVLQAIPALKTQGAEFVLVTCGDAPLISTQTYQNLIHHAETKEVAAVFYSMIVENPSGYGRIIRNKNGEFEQIKEEKDCNSHEASIKEVNTGLYIFKTSSLEEALSSLEPKNAQGEYYLTDVLSFFRQKALPVSVILAPNSDEFSGINDRLALVKVEQKLRMRINERWAKEGVTIHQPETVTIDLESTLGLDCILEPGVVILKSSLGRGNYIESQSRIINSKVGDRNRIRQGTYIHNSSLDDENTVGPYAHLRPDSQLKSHVKIGNFVEIKKSVLEDGVKASHLSYIGDAFVGRNTNIGCGFITCNYDGSPEKKVTTIEEEVFIGSDSQTVAPVTLGRGSYIASGTTVTRDVPPEALALSRVKQVNKIDYAKKFRKKKDV